MLTPLKFLIKHFSISILDINTFFLEKYARCLKKYQERLNTYSYENNYSSF